MALSRWRADGANQCAAGALIFIKKIGRKIDAIAGAPAQQIDNRAASGFTHQVKTGHLQRAKHMHLPALIHGAFPCNLPPFCAKTFANGLVDGVELERVFANNDVAGGF
ncbi:MAG: hypothetical protein R2911_30205 [Caldilineaceae bacterium]